MARVKKSVIPLSVKLCSDKAAYEVRIQRKTSLDMKRLKLLFEASDDPKIVLHTPHIIILQSGSAEATISKDGRVLIKRVLDESEATQVALKILQPALLAVFKS